MVHRETSLEGLRKHRAAISGPPSAASAAASASAAVAEAQAEAAAQAAETKKLGKYPPPLVESSPAKTFARFGAADWDERRTAFRDPIKAAAE